MNSFSAVAKVRNVNNGATVNMSLVVRPRGPKGQWLDLRAVAFGKLAETLSSLELKDKRVWVSGHLENSKPDDDGKKGIILVVNDFRFLDAREDAESGEAAEKVDASPKFEVAPRKKVDIDARLKKAGTDKIDDTPF